MAVGRRTAGRKSRSEKEKEKEEEEEIPLRNTDEVLKDEAKCRKR